MYSYTIETVIVRCVCSMHSNIISQLFLFTPANVIDSVSILGSDSGQILLLFNSNLVVMVTLDKEFSRIIVNESFVIETSLKPYDREFLPERVAPLINFVFSSPLLFAMTKEGLICIL